MTGDNYKVWVAGSFRGEEEMFVGFFFKEMGGRGIKANPGVTQVRKTPARR